MADPKWFAGRLRELREAAGLTRTQLADRARLRSEKGIRDIEQGLRMPYWDTVLALCDALGVTPDAFTQEPAERAPTGPGRPPRHEQTDTAAVPAAEKASGPRRKRGENTK